MCWFGCLLCTMLWRDVVCDDREGVGEGCDGRVWGVVGLCRAEPGGIVRESEILRVNRWDQRKFEIANRVDVCWGWACGLMGLRVGLVVPTCKILRCWTSASCGAHSGRTCGAAGAGFGTPL